MRLVETHPNRIAMLEDPRAIDRIRVESTFELTEERRQRLSIHLQRELNEATTARWPQEVRWKENTRQYEGIPEVAVKNHPIENAPNCELNVSGIVVDSIYAQTKDIMWATAELVQVRPTGITGGYADVAPHLQILANRLASQEIGLKSAANNSLLDCIKHGTMVYYIPWTEKIRHTDIARISSRGPRVFSPALDDVLTPGGAENFDEFIPWVGIRAWLTATDMETRRSAYGWKIDGAQTTSSSGYTRNAREQAGNTRSSTNRISNLYDIWAVFGTFDVDGDGIERDLLIYYNLSGARVVHAMWNPYDNLPIELAVYQCREHLIHGIGTVEMCSQFQKAATTIVNEFMANAMLANNRAWVGPIGAVPGDTIRIRPGKYIGMANPQDVQALQLADVYPGSLQALSILNQMWERRTGVNEVSSPRPSSMLGNRTPGITALTLMQQANRRFAPAFESMRDATAGAVWQSLMRYHERLRMGDTAVEEHIQRMFPDPEIGGSVIAALKDPDFDQGMVVEMSATTATANAIQDRQDLIQVAGILGAYYDKAIQYMTLASTQGIPEEQRQMYLKIANGTAEIVKRTLSKFDQIRDAEKLVLDLEEEINALPSAPPALLGAAGPDGGMDESGGSGDGQGGPSTSDDGGGAQPSQSSNQG